MTPDTSVTQRGVSRCLLVVAVFSLLSLTAAVAQERRDPATADNSSRQETHKEDGASVRARHPSSAELNRESRESAGEGENAEFKHSATVRKISRFTGLTVNQVYWLSLVVNFGVIAGVILWLSKKNLPGAFRNRTAQIQKAMEEARKASEDANRRLADIEARLSHLDAEIGQMRSAAEQEAAAEEARIRAAAEEDGRKIAAAAEQEIAAAAKAARRELTAHAASLAVSLAARQIHVDRQTDEGLLRDFVQELSGGKGDGR